MPISPPGKADTALQVGLLLLHPMRRVCRLWRKNIYKFLAENPNFWKVKRAVSDTQHHISWEFPVQGEDTSKLLLACSVATALLKQKSWILKFLLKCQHFLWK